MKAGMSPRKFQNVYTYCITANGIITSLVYL